MQNVFLDSDVCLDVLVRREPFTKESSKVFTLMYDGVVNGFTSTMALINIHYFLRKDVGNQNAKNALIRFKTLVTVLDVTDQTINEALILDFPDFEDAVQYLTAKKNNLECVVTRNVKDYKKSKIPVYTPQQYLTLFA